MDPSGASWHSPSLRDRSRVGMTWRISKSSRYRDPRGIRPRRIRGAAQWEQRLKKHPQRWRTVRTARAASRMRRAVQTGFCTWCGDVHSGAGEREGFTDVWTNRSDYPRNYTRRFKKKCDQVSLLDRWPRGSNTFDTLVKVDLQLETMVICFSIDCTCIIYYK